MTAIGKYLGATAFSVGIFFSLIHSAHAQSVDRSTLQNEINRFLNICSSGIQKGQYKMNASSAERHCNCVVDWHKSKGLDRKSIQTLVKYYTNKLPQNLSFEDEGLIEGDYKYNLECLKKYGITPIE